MTVTESSGLKKERERKKKKKKKKKEREKRKRERERKNCIAACTPVFQGESRRRALL